MAMPHGTPWWLPPVLAAGLSLVSALYVQKVRTGATNDQYMAQHVATLEAKQEDMAGQIAHIQSQVDKLVDGLIAK